MLCLVHPHKKQDLAAHTYASHRRLNKLIWDFVLVTRSLYPMPSLHDETAATPGIVKIKDVRLFCQPSSTACQNKLLQLLNNIIPKKVKPSWIWMWTDNGQRGQTWPWDPYRYASSSSMMKSLAGFLCKCKKGTIAIVERWDVAQILPIVFLLSGVNNIEDRHSAYKYPSFRCYRQIIIGA